MVVENENILGKEKVGKLLFNLALPAIIGQIINLLYNLVDRIFIGHLPEIGTVALTGVGVTLPLTIIISAFANLVGMGGSPKAAIKMGENDNDAAEKILGNCFTMLIILSVSLTAFFLTFGEKFLLMFGASEATLPHAVEYFNILTLGTIFSHITIGLNSFISTQGFSKTSMVTILIGALINVVLDPILMFGFNMGVKGAAWATVISQAVSAIWVLKFLCGKKTSLKIKRENMRLESKIIIPIILLGLAPFVMQSTESIINIVFNSSLLKYGGDSAVGAMTILTSAMQFTFLPLSGLTQGAQPIISYNYGAGNKDRVKKGFKYLLISSVAYSTIFWLFIMLAPGVFSSLFTKDPYLIEIAKRGLRIYMGAAFLLGIQTACQQTFISLGNAKASLFLALLRKIILLLPLILIMPNFFTDKVFAVFLAEPIADIIAVVITVALFAYQFKRVLNSMVPYPITSCMDDEDTEEDVSHEIIGEATT